jgi:predicted nucleic acid-binding protein
MGLILDTSVIITQERQGKSTAELLASIRTGVGLEPIALSTISVIELEHGVWRAKDVAQASRRQTFLDDLFAAIPTYPLTFEIARCAARIDGESKRGGIVIPFRGPANRSNGPTLRLRDWHLEPATLPVDPRPGSETTLKPLLLRRPNRAQRIADHDVLPAQRPDREIVTLSQIPAAVIGRQ